MEGRQVFFVLELTCSEELSAFPWAYLTVKLDQGSGGGETFFFLDSLTRSSRDCLQHSFSLPLPPAARGLAQPSFLYLHLFGGWKDPESQLMVCKTLQTTRLALVDGGQVRSDVNLGGGKGLIRVSRGGWCLTPRLRRCLAYEPPSHSALRKHLVDVHEHLKNVHEHLKNVQDFFYRGQRGALPWKVRSDRGNNISNEVTVLGAQTPGDLYLYLLGQQALRVALRALPPDQAHPTQDLYWDYCFKQACLRLGCGNRFLDRVRRSLPPRFDEFCIELKNKGTQLESARLCMEFFVNMIAFPCVLQNYTFDLRPEEGASAPGPPAHQVPSFFSGAKNIQELKYKAEKQRRRQGRRVAASLRVPCEKFEPMTPGLGRTDDCESLSMRTLIHYTQFMVWARGCKLSKLHELNPLLACSVVVLLEHYQLLWMHVVIDTKQKEIDLDQPLTPAPQPDTGPVPDAEALAPGHYLPTQQEIEANTAHVTLGLAARDLVLGGQGARGRSGQRFYLLESTAQFLGDNLWDDPENGAASLGPLMQEFYARFRDSRLLQVDRGVSVALGEGAAGRAVNIGNSYEWAQRMYLRVCNFLTFPSTEGLAPAGTKAALQTLRWQVPCRLDRSGERVQSGVSFAQFVAWACSENAEGPSSGSSLHESRVFVGALDVIKYTEAVLDAAERAWQKTLPPLDAPLRLPKKVLTRSTRELEKKMSCFDKLLKSGQPAVEVLPVNSINYLTCEEKLQSLPQSREFGGRTPCALFTARQDDGWFWRQHRESKTLAATGKEPVVSVHYLLYVPNSA